MKPEPSNSPNNTLQIFCFGASSVYGVGTVNGSWADLIKQRINLDLYGNNSGKKIEVFNLGISGEKSAQLEQRLEQEVKAREAFHKEWRKLIIISCGTNDSRAVGSKDSFISSIDEFRDTATQIVELAQKFTSNIIGVGLTPVDNSRTQPLAGKDTYFDSERIREFEAAYQSVCESKNIAFLENYMPATKLKWVEEYLYSDGLHSNDKAHQWIFDRLWPMISPILN